MWRFVEFCVDNNSLNLSEAVKGTCIARLRIVPHARDLEQGKSLAVAASLKISRTFWWRTDKQAERLRGGIASFLHLPETSLEHMP
jgi:hypothetical protein